LIAHFYDESVRQSRKTIEMDPSFALAHNQLAEVYLRKQMRDDAITEFQKAVQLSEGSPVCTANLARAYASSGKNAEAGQLLEGLKKRSNSAYSNAAEIAMVYAALGDKAQAMPGSNEVIASATTRVSCCVQASIPCAPTQDSETWCTVLV